jgi:hypothetical protein
VKSTLSIEELTPRLTAAHALFIAAIVSLLWVELRRMRCMRREILSNLPYLIRTLSDDAKEVVKYLEEADNQVVRLVQIATRLTGHT